MLNNKTLLIFFYQKLPKFSLLKNWTENSENWHFALAEGQLANIEIPRRSYLKIAAFYSPLIAMKFFLIQGWLFKWYGPKTRVDTNQIKQTFYVELKT